jgi:hypothetical protein
MWTCPRCGRSFTRREQPHSCGDYTVEGFLVGASERALELFGRFSAEVGNIRTFEYAPAKTRVGFQTRRIFAAINGLGKDSIRGHLVMHGEFPSDKFTSITRVCDTDVAHNFRIDSEEFFDDEFRELVKEALKYGG